MVRTSSARRTARAEARTGAGKRRRIIGAHQQSQLPHGELSVTYLDNFARKAASCSPRLCLPLSPPLPATPHLITSCITPALWTFGRAYHTGTSYLFQNIIKRRAGRRPCSRQRLSGAWASQRQQERRRRFAQARHRRQANAVKMGRTQRGTGASLPAAHLSLTAYRDETRAHCALPTHSALSIKLSAVDAPGVALLSFCPSRCTTLHYKIWFKQRKKRMHIRAPQQRMSL